MLKTLLEHLIKWFLSPAYTTTTLDDEPLPMPPPTPQPPQTPSLADKLFEAAVNALGSHLTLDPSVPEELGCAEAVSALLMQIGISDLPEHGIAGTAELYLYLKDSPNFEFVDSAQYGAIILSPTGSGSHKIPHGHVGVILKKGIASNNSTTGLWGENFSITGWLSHYAQVGGLKTYYILPVG